MLNLFPRPTLPQRLTMILQALQKAAAARAAKDWSISPAILLIWPYLNRVAARFDALLSRIRTGRLRPPRARTPVERTRSAPKPRPPQNFGWLFHRVPDSVHYRGQLHHLLREPEMVALLAEIPQVGRLLRPLCRMLGLSLRGEPDLPPALFPPKIPRKARTAPPTPTQSDPSLEDGPAPMGTFPAPA